MSDLERPAPARDDPDTAGFWEAAQRHELVVRSCLECGCDLHFPRAYCKHCGSWNTLWRTVRGAATLYSWTVSERQVHPAFPVPYTIVLVQLDDAPTARLLGSLQGAPPLVAGMAMTVEWEDRPGGAVIPQWAPVWPPSDERVTA